MLPPLTVMSLAVKPLTDSENAKVKVTSPLAMGSVMSSLIVSVGGAVSKPCVA